MVFVVVKGVGVLVLVGFVDVIEVVFEVGFVAKNGVVGVDTVWVDDAESVDAEDNKLVLNSIKK